MGCFYYTLREGYAINQLSAERKNHAPNETMPLERKQNLMQSMRLLCPVHYVTARNPEYRGGVGMLSSRQRGGRIPLETPIVR